MNFFSRKPKTTIRTYCRPIGQMMWNPEIPEGPKAIVPEVLVPETPKPKAPVASGWQTLETTATQVLETPMHPYREPKFQEIFQTLLALGWDLPAKHATVLVELLGHPGPRTLEQEFLMTRYLRDMGQ